jgi:hypothetical protein
MSTFSAVRKPIVIAIFGVTVLLSGCGSDGASKSDVAQAIQSAAQAQAQKDSVKQQQDTQASLAAEVKKLTEDAAKAAAAKTAAANAAAAAAAAKTAAAKAAAAKAKSITSCGGNLSAGASTTCAFAYNVENSYYQSGGGYSTFAVYSPVTGLYYTMTCTPGVPTVCRGGNNALVYIR